MKALLAIIVVLAGLGCAKLYFDYQNENSVYQFCNRYSIGNLTEKVNKDVERAGLEIQQTENKLIISHPVSYQFIQAKHSCEITVKNNKIIELAFIRE